MSVLRVNEMKSNNKKPTQDEIIEKMVEEWDIVRCAICHERISMLDAIHVKGEDYFICKRHKNNEEYL